MKSDGVIKIGSLTRVSRAGISFTVQLRPEDRGGRRLVEGCEGM